MVTRSMAEDRGGETVLLGGGATLSFLSSEYKTKSIPQSFTLVTSGATQVAKPQNVFSTYVIESGRKRNLHFTEVLIISLAS